MRDILPNSLRGQSNFDTVSLFSQVLLIEDDPAHARLISRAVQPFVGSITHVTRGQNALDELVSSLYDFVFCDLNLPDVDGVSLLKQIKDIRPSIPLVMITSSGQLQDAVAAMREGAWDFMVKEFTPELSMRLRIIVERAADRCLSQMREVEIRSQRDAFSFAAYTATNGLAILGERGNVVFANQAFQNFLSYLGWAVEQSTEPESISVVDALARHDYHVARELFEELDGRPSETLWLSEVSVHEDEETEYNFELALNTLSSQEASQTGLPDGLRPPDLRYHILWVRDVSERRASEQFQRDLLSTTTHDLKGPLGAILASSELLSETSFTLDEEKRTTLITSIASCARNAITIIDELLSARRIQDGVMVCRPRVLSVSQVLEEILLDYRPMAEAKKITFSFKVDEEELEIFADRTGISRVLGNVVSNALKFTGKGGEVKLSAERVEEGVSIAIADTGPGISKEVQHRLFERFTRAEQHKEIDGTGLGLFVVKNIVDAHHGRVSLKSELGKGTTFYLVFPNQSQ